MYSIRRRRWADVVSFMPLHEVERAAGPAREGLDRDPKLQSCGNNSNFDARAVDYVVLSALCERFIGKYHECAAVPLQWLCTLDPIWLL